MEYGWIMLVVLAVMGGIIAYLGDKIGSRVGKQKIKLFGLRPKYTSILVTILTGISIAAITLGVMSILSEKRPHRFIWHASASDAESPA